MSVKYELWKVTYSDNKDGSGEFLLLQFPTLEEAKQYAKQELQIGKTFWKRNTQGDLYATNKHEVCHYTIDEVVTE